MKWLRDKRLRLGLIHAFSLANIGFDVWWMSLCGVIFALVTKPHSLANWGGFVAQMTIWMLALDVWRGYVRAVVHEQEEQ